MKTFYNTFRPTPHGAGRNFFANIDLYLFRHSSSLRRTAVERERHVVVDDLSDQLGRMELLSCDIVACEVHHYDSVRRSGSQRVGQYLNHKGILLASEFFRSFTVPLIAIFLLVLKNASNKAIEPVIMSPRFIVLVGRSTKIKKSLTTLRKGRINSSHANISNIMTLSKEPFQSSFNRNFRINRLPPFKIDFFRNNC